MGKNDHVTAAILSSLAVIIQLLLFILSTISNSVGVSNIFVMEDFIPFVTLLAVFLSLTLAGIYSFIYKTFIFSFKEPKRIKLLNKIRNWIFEGSIPPRRFTDKRETGKKFMLTASVMLLISILVFIISSIIFLYTKEISTKLLGIQIGFWQTISYLIIWVSTSLILFIWIINEREEANKFKEEDYIRNLYDSLREHGYLSVTVKSAQTIPGTYVYRYVTAKFGTDSSPQSKYLKTSYDGKRIFAEFDSYEEFEKDITNNSPKKNGSNQEAS